MHRTSKQNTVKAKKQGMSNIDILRMKEIAKKATKEMEQESVEKAFLYMLAIPLNVLVNDYWEKSAKKRAPKFIKDVISLYESVQAGAVKESELAELLKEMADVDVKAEWLKGKVKNRKDGDV